MQFVSRFVVAPAAALLLIAPTALAAAEGASHAEQPQLISGPPTGLITAITTLVVFALLLAVLGRFAWGPIVASLKAREDRIRRDIADAEAARQRAEATLKEYSARLAAAEEKVREMITAATTQGEKMATDIRMRAQQESEEARKRATREIEAAKDQAVIEIHEKAAEVATDMAEKILRRAIGPDEQLGLVQRGLDQLQTAGNGQTAL